MLKRHAAKLALLQRTLDMLSVFIAWMSAYYIRFQLLPGGDPGQFPDFFLYSPLIVLVSLYFYTLNNLYHSKRYYSWYREIISISKANIQSFAAIFVFLYFTSRVRMSRLTFLIFFLLSLLFTILERSVIRRLLHSLRTKGKNLRQIILLGHGNQLQSYVKTLSYLPHLGIQPVGWADSGGMAEQYMVPEMQLEDIGKNELFQPDMVIVGYPSRSQDRLNSTINYLNQHYLPVMLIPDLQYNYLGYTIEEFEGIPMIEVNPVRMSAAHALLKRFVDILGALVGLLILSPLFILISILVKLTSRGPIFYGQERMSVDGKTFTMWKFRSMKVDAEQQSGAKWATKNDNRKTVIGSFLRKTSLDEIPQFWNVLIGNMSLVGPRPERPVFIEQFKEQIPSYMLRHRVKAGITGWAQINGWRGDTSIEKRIEFDIYYIKHWSIWFDIRIILLTFVKGFVNPNAY